MQRRKDISREELIAMRAAAGRIGGKAKVKKGIAMLSLEERQALSRKALAQRAANREARKNAQADTV